MVERLHGGLLQALHHVRGALLVLLEMCGLDVALIGLLGGIDLEDANLRGVLSTLHREEADDTRLTLHAHAVHLVGKQKYFFYLFDVSVRSHDLFLLVGSVAVATISLAKVHLSYFTLLIQSPAFTTQNTENAYKSLALSEFILIFAPR